MKLSIYTFVRNGLYFDYHVVDMLKHHLPLADEIMVNEGYSTDGTYERIEGLDPKIKVHRRHWDRSDPKTMRSKYVAETRKLCTGDWCILLDADEFIPEWEFDRLRAYLATATRPIIRLKYTHFYANYRVCQDTSNRVMPPTYNSRIHKNRDDIEVWGDASTVRLRSQDQEAVDPDVVFDVYHFGEVRHPARLREKWHDQYLRNMRNRLKWIPAFAFSLLPHDWLDKDLLPRLRIYEGPLMQCVRMNPDEFVRDGFKVYEYLKRAGASNGAGQ
jgi:glycosyltransferase involved in cell wall biosynthesis